MILKKTWTIKESSKLDLVLGIKNNRVDNVSRERGCDINDKMIQVNNQIQLKI